MTLLGQPLIREFRELLSECAVELGNLDSPENHVAQRCRALQRQLPPCVGDVLDLPELPGRNLDAGHRSDGPVPAGRYQVERLAPSEMGTVAVLLALPRRDGTDYGQRYAYVRCSILREHFEAE